MTKKEAKKLLKDYKDYLNKNHTGMYCKISGYSLNKYIKEQLTIPVVSNSVICCPACGNERLEDLGGGWYICCDKRCDWGDKL